MPLVLITGASTGIGAATAVRFAGQGWNVLAGVRSRDAGAALAERAPAGRIVPVELDVTDRAQIEAAAGTVAAAPGATRDGGLDALVNNAGIGVGGPLEVLSDADLRRQFDVNFFGQVAVTRVLLGALRAARGRLVFVSSIGGRVAMGYNGAYSASKFAIEALADALRVELRSSGIQVALIEPGSVATPIWEKSREEARRALKIPPELQAAYGHVPELVERTLASTGARGIPPERVAATIAGAVGARRMRARYVVGTDARAMLAIRGLLPDRAFDALARRALGA
jgi:NAD(P)-dependent dehydrogenase (short-subunit alcohol dehydrogenase family)